MEQGIITAVQIREYLQISVNVKSDEVNKYVLEAQKLDLMPFLGEKMYYDFITNYLTNTDYLKLYEGGTYTPDSDGILVAFTGIKEILCYYAYNRFMNGNNEQLTRTGFVEKSTPQSLAIDHANLLKKSASILATANQLKSTTLKYIERNLSLFPLYPKKETSDFNKSGVTMRAFRKNRY